MQTSLNNFNANLIRSRQLVGLAQSLATLVAPAVDLTDLHRAALVQAVSALDHFVHEFVRLGMLEIQAGTRQPTAAFLAFKIPLSLANAAGSNPGAWLEQAIRDAHSWQSFQMPDKIADAIRLVSTARLWEDVALQMALRARDLKIQLAAIVDRRNKIAHEADMDPLNPGTRWPISASMVAGAIDFLEQVAGTIYQVAK